MPPKQTSPKILFGPIRWLAPINLSRSVFRKILRPLCGDDADITSTPITVRVTAPEGVAAVSQAARATCFADAFGTVAIAN
jgi:hypothetical protein